MTTCAGRFTKQRERFHASRGPSRGLSHLRSELGEDLRQVLEVAGLLILDALVESAMQRGSLSIVEVVALCRDHLVERNELDRLSLRQVRWFIQLSRSFSTRAFIADMP